MNWSGEVIAGSQPEGSLPAPTAWHRQIQALVNILPDLGVFLERDGRIVAVNDAFAHLVGIAAPRIAGSSLFDLLKPPLDHAETYLRRCAASRQRLPGALTFTSADGADIPCRCDGAAMPVTEPGAPSLILFHCRPKQEAASEFALLNRKIGALMREVLTRREVEKTLQEDERKFRELNETLERRIEERTQALRTEMRERQKVEAALQQVQRLEAVGQLTGGVAHDFNNLLTVVVGNLGLMRHLASSSEEVPKERLRHLIDRTQRAAARGERLTRQLLAFSRKGSLQPQVIDPHVTITGFATFLQHAVGEAIALHLDFGPGRRAFCKLDPAQFEAAVLNLAVNARDAMPEGGTLTIRTAHALIGPEETRANPILAAGAYVLVSVSDTGIGMAAAVVQKAFEPFFTTKEVGKGTGLGLAQVWGFVKQSGGHATIASEIGTGTVVTLYLPECAETPTAESVAQERKEQHGSETILVVEDDEDVQEVTVATLNSLGYRTVLARDGREALAVLHREDEIELLFTDYVMPGGLSGAELAREARALRPDLKVLLTTGYARHAGTDEMAISRFPIIAKPYRRVDLAEAIRATLASDGERGVKPA